MDLLPFFIFSIICIGAGIVSYINDEERIEKKRAKGNNYAAGNNTPYLVIIIILVGIIVYMGLQLNEEYQFYRIMNELFEKAFR